MPKIFDMFYRGDESSDGSGLGLYIVNEVVNKLKGKINITSDAGKGTDVHLVFPNKSLQNNSDSQEI